MHKLEVRRARKRPNHFVGNWSIVLEDKSVSAGWQKQAGVMDADDVKSHDAGMIVLACVLFFATLCGVCHGIYFRMYEELPDDKVDTLSVLELMDRGEGRLRVNSHVSADSLEVI